ncbi:ABC transporter permease [uncultured Leifsonia sp.]|uniref:ABC transporter permease n=1 Tax=uncultured Leifsonia sp. TaxID=340359 RepID=UPI0028D52F33|nr:ABC transporter permease [uncultured Leifsonia sp.]
MSAAFVVTQRNLSLFFRDRVGVFFSLLSALILIALYALFLGNLQVDTLTAKLPAASDHDIRWFVNSWVFAGITMITTLTTALASLSVFVDDRSSGRFRDFLVSPVRRSHLIFGYVFSSFIVSFVMSLVIVVVGQLFLWIQNDDILTADRILHVVGYVALCSGAFAALSSFVVTFLRSSGAFATLSTVVGTIIGFLAGAYIPSGTLPAGVVNVMNALPFAQAALLLRGPYTEQAVDALTAGPHGDAAAATVRAYYGISASIGDLDVSAALAVGTLCVVLLVFASLGAWRLSGRIR